MDISTLLGIFMGTVLVLGAIVMGPGAITFVNVPALMITVGGTLAATLINFPIGKVVGVFSVVKKAFLHRTTATREQIELLVQLARVARSEGLLALENAIQETKDPFLRKAVQLVVDGTDPEVLRDMLSTEIERLRDRHLTGKNILEAMGASAPAFGMVGTLIGLIQMLRNMSDPSSLGTGMATALLTTFYGSLMANLVFLPTAGKLNTRSKEEVLAKDIIVEGITAIQAGLNPRIVEEKLKAFVEPKLRARITTKKKAA